MSSNVLLVPVQLQAFVLNPAVCNTGSDDDKGARIIPVSQPNYTFLRLDNFLVQSDVLRHADLHNAAPAETNPRLTDLGAPGRPATRRNRCGVYLHWILPQLYRSGISSADSVSASSHEKARLKHGLPPRPPPPAQPGSTKPDPSASTPEFHQPPTRWIVLRKLDLDSVEPAAAKPYFNEYQAWVIESDYLWTLDDIPLEYDLQVDVSPFVIGVTGGQDDIQQQAEVFIGRKTPLERWAEDPAAKYADISLLRSSNQLFADFQQHNTNVFSILDNFVYQDDGPQYLDKASASYYLVGWHSAAGLDPLGSQSQYPRATKLDSLCMAIKDAADSDPVKTWLASTDAACLCLHGALYGVNWDMSSKPLSVPADDYAKALQSQDVPAVSVGTTPMDSLITYCRSRQASGSQDTVAQLEEDILAIDSLLHARDDGVEGQREAKDTVYNWNFSRSPGGINYHLGGQDSTGQPTQPGQAAIDGLQGLNRYQLLLDSCERSAAQYRWDMFACWWKYVSDVGNKKDKQAGAPFKREAQDLSSRLEALETRIKGLRTTIKETIESQGAMANAKTGTLPFFYRTRDPTVLIGGIESGWPSDYSDNVLVRLPLQVVEATSPLPSDLSDLVAAIRRAFPNTTQLGEVTSLIGEFFSLIPGDVSPGSPPAGQSYPQFHDQLAATADSQLWRDRWGDRQPWFPLYAEWEVEYTHIPLGSWSLGQQTARLSDAQMVRYGVAPADGTPLWEQLKTGDAAVEQDVRILSGRVLVLPQPSFSLASKVRQLFQDTPPAILDKYLSQQDRQDLVENISRLSYLSCPLAGLTEGLLTLSQGTHIKPENKESVGGQPSTVSAIKAAEFPSAGFTRANIEKIKGNSALTPYAAMTRFSSQGFCPFKPVTHGQFRFRKLNIIDKFGQALTAIDPKPRPQGPLPLYPCISDSYEPQVVQLTDGTAAANTVRQNSGQNCEYVQLPPSINQNARLNASFVVRVSTGLGETGTVPRSSSSAYWRPATEWEDPVWGWLVINYADSGIQLFLKDGTFYREVRIGSPSGAVASPKWLPFAPSKLPDGADTAQLDALVGKLQDSGYLGAFWSMVVGALDNMAPSPSSYAQFLSAIIGKPLALVNMGWSLELDGPAKENQSTNSEVKDPVPHLLAQAADDESCYSFKVKFGDRLREYDGLVGYFDSNPSPTGLQDELLLDNVKTYFVDGADKTTSPDEAVLQAISVDTYPEFKPFWIPPFPEAPPYEEPISPELYEDRRNRELHVFGAIIDPFTPVHAYTSLLPAQALQLPPWTWQAALQTMTAFFHAGPLHITGDVAEYNSSQELTTDSMREAPLGNVSLPLMSAGDWNWLQPYVDPNPSSELPVFNTFGIEKKGNLLSPGFQEGPYTALEGFMQLRRPIGVGKPSGNSAAQS